MNVILFFDARRATGLCGSSCGILLACAFPLTGRAAEPEWSLGPLQSTHPGSYPESVAIGDVTGDGLADVVMTTDWGQDPVNDFSVFVYPQSGGGLASPARYSYGVLDWPWESGLALADLDEDGVLDVVVGHSTGISVFLADGAGSLEPAIWWGEGADAPVLSSLDLDLDGHTDIVGHSPSEGPSVFFGDRRLSSHWGRIYPAR